MKINQFAVVDTPFETQLKELATIGFYDESVQVAHAKNATAVWRELLRIAFPEVQDGRVKFRDIAINTREDLAGYLNSGAPVTEEVFNAVALQLLGFVEDVDYTFDKVAEAVATINLPLYHKAGRWDADDVLTAWYQLLVTHTRNGLQFIDDLASRGYFMKNNVPLFFNGKAMATFDTSALIREVVYVETDVDTDGDGVRDLVRAEVIRPDTGVKVPTLFTASPYYQGLNNEANDALVHNVDVALLRKTPNTLTYEEIKYEPEQEALPEAHEIAGEVTETTESFTGTSHVDLNNYFLARGFAVVYSAGVGTRHSDGMQDTGSPEQVASMRAVVEWLAGDRLAFIDKHSGQTIKANWSNGKVAMTGKSYLGTLATAVATTGVRGLETVISEAAISDWYQYYRDNGLVIAPGGFPGEDMDVLAELVYSRMLDSADWHRTKMQWHGFQHATAEHMDRTTGDYNTYWDARNYLNNVPNIQADIVMVHGLNDWNVKPRQVFRLWQNLQKLPVVKKLYLHQGQHIYINNNRSLDFADQMNLWLSYKLYGVQNQAASQLPDVTWQANDQAETWETGHEWGATTPTTLPLAAETATVQYEDWQIADDFAAYKQDFNAWRQQMLQRENDKLDVNRVVFVQPAFEQDMVIDGEVTLQLRIKSSADVGLVSAMLVDYGEARRLAATPQPQGVLIDRGTGWQPTPLVEFQLAKPTTEKMISIGHINLQNRTAPWRVDDLVPDEFVDVALTLQPTRYRLPAGHQLGVIIYGTDFEMTVRGNQDIRYTIDVEQSQLIVPLQDNTQK